MSTDPVETIGMLEASLGLMPSGYRSFLLKTDGKRPEAATFGFTLADGTRDSSSVYGFFTLANNDSTRELLQILSIYDDRVPLGTLPIADDPFGNLVLLDVAAKAPGAVYFWDHELESPDEPYWDNVTRLADSFDAFIASLKQDGD